MPRVHAEGAPHSSQWYQSGARQHRREWQIGYLLKSLAKDELVFLRQAPTARSDNKMYLSNERVRPLDITMAQAMMIVKHMGIGSAAALRGVDLTLPGGASVSS
jgi:hypothetical protein